MIFQSNSTIYIIKRFSLFVLFTLLSFKFNAQLTIINSKTPDQLVSDVLIGPGVSVSNINFKGDKNTGISEFFYSNVTGSNNLGLDRGVFLSTGNVQNASGKNSSQNTGSQGSNVSDKDLDSIIKITGKKTTDATVIEFDFIPMSDSIQFKYVFASEEYPEFNCSSFNDVFAFLLTGPDPNGGGSFTNKNLAIVPGTPNTNVSVNTINSGTVSGNNSETICDNIDPNWKSYSTFFVPNFPNLLGSDQITFDGYTVPLVAKSAVKCGETYHMKIAVADVGDQNYDSGVFLLANSLFSNIITAETKEQKSDLTISMDSIIVENCTKGLLTFKLGKKSNQNTIINYTLKGTAINGTDYQSLPGTISIPANQDSIQVIITPIQDNLSENEETIIVEYNAGGCAGNQSKTFVIRDIPLAPVTDFNYDSLICLNSPDIFVNRASGFVKGGVYTSNSLDLLLNSSTGKITPSSSKPGIYQVTYTVNPTNNCEISGSSTINIEIKDLQNPITQFSYPSPICQSNSTVNPNLILDFTLGGKFYAKTKLSIDSTTGSINLGLSDPGVHKVYYQFEKNECFNQKIDSTEIEIIANPSPIPGFTYPSPICKIDVNPTPNLSLGFVNGGTFKTDSTKLIFKNSTTGELDLNLTPPGTYNVYYEVKNNQNCTVTTVINLITIIDQSNPNVSFKYDDIICTGSGKKSPILSSGFTLGGKFSSNLGLSIDSLTGILDLDKSKKGIYQIKYSFPSTNCNPAVDTVISLQVDSLITKNTSFNYVSPICITASNPVPSGTFETGGEFTAPQGVTISKTNGRINLAGTVPGTYEITYTIQPSGCYSKSEGKASITIESSNTPVVNFSYERPICLNSLNTLPILPSGFSTGGVFSTLETDISVNDSTGKLDLSKAKGGNTYKIEYNILSSACGGSGTGSTEILIADLLNPDTDFSYDDSLFCVNTPKLTPKVGLSFEIGGKYSSDSKDLIIDSITGEINFIDSKTGSFQIKYKTEEKSCIAKDSTVKTIKISKLPIVTLSTNNPICIGDTLKLKSPNYQGAIYKWNGPDGFTSTDSLPILTPLKIEQKGLYSLSIKHNNCTDSSFVNVDIKDVENIPLTPIGPFCKSDTNLYKIVASVKNGIWSDTTLIKDRMDSSIVYFRPSSSNFDTLNITYKTNSGCGGLGTLRIINNSLPITNFDINSKEGCAPINVKLLLPFSSNLDSCDWFIDNQKIEINKDSIIKFSKQGYFNVKVVSYKNGCMSSLQKDTILKVYPYPIADFISSDTILSSFTPLLYLNNKSINATEYNWVFSDGKTSNLTNPTHTFPLESTDYFVTLYASQRGYCEDSKTIHITIPIDLTVYVPNTFTPNDDDLNEEFLPIISNAIDPTSYTLIIFNRWGEIVFISHDKSIGWRGTFGGNICVDGVYTWKIDFVDLNKKKHNYIGHVTLLK